MQAQTMTRAHVNGVDLEYTTVGNGEPVLLISPVVADGFLPLLSEGTLENRYHLIAYHKRGWLGSTHTVPPVDISDHAADAAALLAELSLHRAHVVGHSSGAAVAAQLAVDRPELVHTLALLELSLLTVPAAEAFLQKVGPAFEAYAAGRHENALSAFLSAVSGLDGERCRAILDSRVPGAFAAALADADTFFGIELPALAAWNFGAAEARSIRQPVLSVTGAETEPLWTAIAASLRSWLPNVEDCIIEGAGHLLQLQRPEAVSRALAAFFARHPMGPSTRLAGG